MSHGSLRLTAKELPAIKDWKINETYKIEVEVKLKEVESSPDYSNMEMSYPMKNDKKMKEIISGRFEIVDVNEYGKNPKTASKKDFEKMLANAYQGKM